MKKPKRMGETLERFYKIEQFINNYDMYYESENEHSACGLAKDLADVLLANYVKPELVLTILREYFGDYGQDGEES
jgi:hypothetical protein